MMLQRARKRVYVFVMILIDVMPIRLKPRLSIKIWYDFLGARRTIGNNK